MNARQIWQETTKRLEKFYDTKEAENISFVLLEDLFRISREDVMLAVDNLIDEKKLENAISRLQNMEPVQYVTGVTYFFGRKFNVREGVLIPRPETEELVDLVIRQNEMSNPKVLDVGVGSGCIAISLALEIGGEVHGSDVSTDAIQLARWNAKKMDAEVNFILSDIMKEQGPVTNLDILVSNPPYIPERDKRMMFQNVLDYEPHVALFVPESDPLKFYKRIAQEGKRSLSTGGKLYFEIHEKFGAEVKELLVGLGYSLVKIYKDMQGKDRMISAVNQSLGFK